MFRNPKISATLGFAGFGLTALLLSGGSAGAQAGSHTSDVNVVNTPNVNVSSIPAVQLSGTPSVNVNSLPAVQIGPNQTIGVSSVPAVQIAPNQTLNVGNTPTVNIGPNHDVHLTADSTVHLASDATVHIASDQKLHIADDRSPVLQKDIVTFNSGLSDSSDNTLQPFTVPSGKELVIESVSYWSSETSLTSVVLELFVPGGGDSYNLPLCQAINGVMSTSTQVTIRVPSGETVFFGMSRNNTSNASTEHVTFAGYLEDAP